MKIFNVVFCVLFAIFAILQYNDDDPFIWIPIYLYGATLCYLAARGRYMAGAYLLGIVGCLLYAGYRIFLRDGVTEWFRHHQTQELVLKMQADKPWIEETRELGGLLIVALVLGINWLAGKKQPQKTGVSG